MKVTVYTTKIVKEVVEVPDKFAVMLDDDWVDSASVLEWNRACRELEDAIWPLVAKDTYHIAAVWDEKDELVMMED